MTIRTALIDGDIIAYRIAAWAAANQIDALEARESAIGLTREWAEEAGARKIIVALSHRTKKSFRYDVLDTYKHNRKSSIPPELRETLHDVLRDEFRSVERPHLEGDDVIGILATNGKVKNPVIVSIDKDLRQIPGQHYNPQKPEQESGELVPVTPDDGLVKFHTQWLIGDSGDGYGGIYRFGIKKAEPMLAEFYAEDGAYAGDDAEKAIVDLYDKKGYPFEYCVQMARVAKILQAEDWDADQKEPILFNPTHSY